MEYKRYVIKHDGGFPNKYMQTVCDIMKYWDYDIDVDTFWNKVEDRELARDEFVGSVERYIEEISPDFGDVLVKDSDPDKLIESAYYLFDDFTTYVRLQHLSRGIHDLDSEESARELLSVQLPLTIMSLISHVRSLIKEYE